MSSDSLDMARLGRAIVTWRERRGWSTHRLAVRADLADPYLRKLEAGDGARVGIDVLIRLAAALGTTADVLLADAGTPTASRDRDEADVIYADLDDVTRPAWLRMGHSLRRIQEEYAALQADEEEEGELPEAASSEQAEAEHYRRESEQYGDVNIGEREED